WILRGIVVSWILDFLRVADVPDRSCRCKKSVLRIKTKANAPMILTVERPHQLAPWHPGKRQNPHLASGGLTTKSFQFCPILRIFDLTYLRKTGNPMLSHHFRHLPKIVHEEPINISMAPRRSRALQPVMRIIKKPWRLTIKFRIQKHVSRAVAFNV